MHTWDLLGASAHFVLDSLTKERWHPVLFSRCPHVPTSSTLRHKMAHREHKDAN